MKKLNKLEDEELIFFLKLQNEEAFDILLERYNEYAKGLALSILRDFSGTGLTQEELALAALATLRGAIKSFKLGSTKFATYWNVIAKRAMMDYVYENSYKGKSDGFAGFSLDQASYLGEDNVRNYSDVVGVEDSGLGVDIIYKEFINAIKKDRFYLNAKEKKIFTLYLKGLSRDAILRETGVSVPYYYRALKKGKIVLGKHYQK